MSDVASQQFTFQGKTYRLNPVQPDKFIRAKVAEWKELFAEMITPVEGITPAFLDALWIESRNTQSSFYKAFHNLHTEILTPARLRK